MNDFSWDYVYRSAQRQLAELGRSIAETIAQAVEPGLYLLAPDSVYEVRVDGETTTVLRNGISLVGPEARPSDGVLSAVSAEMGGLNVTEVDVFASIALTVAV